MAAWEKCDKPVLKIGNYALGKTLGTGTFGKVKIAEHELLEGHKVAVKILNKQKIRNLNLDSKIQREIQILKLFRHPHVIKLYDVIETPTDIFLIMEYVNNGELFDFIVKNGRLSETGARRFLQQIIAGVEYCHSHMVVHRDLKPENLLLDEYNNVKVADFGLSNIMTDGEFLATSCGSPNYAAPEVISGKLYAGPEVDVWSCGVVLYALVCGHLPFDDDYIPRLFKKIRGGIFEVPMHVSSECRDLLCSMLAVDPLNRITISEIRQHPWFKRDLPKYLQQKPVEISRGVQMVDPQVLALLMQKLGLKDKQKTIQELKEDTDEEKPSPLVVAYHLMCDRIAQEKRFTRSRSKELSHSSSGEPAEEVLLSPQMDLRDERLAFSMDDDDVWTRGGLDSSTLTITKAPPSRQMWKLGILSSSNPQEVMNTVLLVLKEINVWWRFVTPYQLKCIFGAGEQAVKMAVQLFQVRSGKYLLDIKRLSGGVFQFFDLNHKFLTRFGLFYRTDDMSELPPSQSKKSKRKTNLRHQAFLNSMAQSSAVSTRKRSHSQATPPSNQGSQRFHRKHSQSFKLSASSLSPSSSPAPSPSSSPSGSPSSSLPKNPSLSLSSISPSSSSSSPLQGEEANTTPTEPSSLLFKSSSRGRSLSCSPTNSKNSSSSFLSSFNSPPLSNSPPAFPAFEDSSGTDSEISYSLNAPGSSDTPSPPTSPGQFSPSFSSHSPPEVAEKAPKMASPPATPIRSFKPKIKEPELNKQN